MSRSTYDTSMTRCAQCECWAWGCAFPLDYQSVSGGIVIEKRRKRDKGPMKGTHLSGGTPVPVRPEPIDPARVARFREHYRIPSASDPGTPKRNAADYPSGSRCPGFAQIRRWKKDKIQQDTIEDLQRLGINVEDMKAEQGIVD